MNSNHLLQFKAVVKYGSMTKAAEATFVSQPTLSYTLKQLEGELQCRLFDRVGNRLVVNDNGRKLLKYCDRCESLFDDLMRDFRDVSAGDDDFIRVGSRIALNELMMSFFRFSPDIRMKVSRLRTLDSLEDAVDEYDALILGTDETCRAIELGLKAQPLFKNELLLCVAFDHPLAKRDIITLEEIGKYDLAVVRGKNGEGNLYRWIASVGREAGVDFRFVYEVSQEYWRSLYNVPYPFFCYSTICMYEGDLYRDRKCIPIDSKLTQEIFAICYRPKRRERLEGFLDTFADVSKAFAKAREKLCSAV